MLQSGDGGHFTVANFLSHFFDRIRYSRDFGDDIFILSYPRDQRLFRDNGQSGDTGDSFIADLAVGLSCDFIKVGSLVRSEHASKYNRLMEISQRNFENLQA